MNLRTIAIEGGPPADAESDHMRRVWDEIMGAIKPGAVVEDEVQSTPATDQDVQQHVERVIDHALHGRLTPPQKRAVRSSIDRSDRVSPSSDAAVGRVTG